MRDAAKYLRDATFEGMNAGKSLWELIETITLPQELAIPQGHGKVPWIVRSIWEEHLGWFRYESTTELYGTPANSVFPDLITLAGGAEPVLDLATRYLSESQPLKALHIAEAVEAGSPSHRRALEIQLEAQQAILTAAGRENFSEVRWLESEIHRLEVALARTTP